MGQIEQNSTPAGAGGAFPLKLWIYTNFDCNLSCSYCVARSSPKAARKAIGLENARRLVDEAAGLGFDCVYFTGGEPFLLDEIYPMLAHASACLPTVVLTNGMMLRGARMEKLAAIQSDNLVVQVSLDGASAAAHDAYRGAGSWQKTVEGIRALQARGFHVRISTTETPANTGELDALCRFHEALGIPEADHLVRSLARRGFSQEGIEVGVDNVVPEITASADGLFWHPLSTDEDLLVSRSLFPLAEAVQQVRERYTAQPEAAAPTKPFK